ncbi:MAG: hypothetical protein RL341_2560 [Pseudomonadota bacterium]|jgi:uncharacterized membrane-anchored protein
MVKRWLWVVIALQVLWIAGMAASKEAHLARGPAVLLETRPVDPRDLLRGDYVILNYAISSIERSNIRGAVPADTHGKPVYVVLKQGERFHALAYASFEKPALQAGEVMLKGRAGQARWQRGPENQPEDQRPIGVDYGLERFYVAEGTGNPRGEITVQAVVDGSGNALIRNVLIDGVPYAQAMAKQRRN